METASCLYTKITPAEAAKNASDTATFASQNPTNNLAGFSSFSLVPTAHAQESQTDLGTQISQQLTMPFYLVIVAFFGFIALMSFVYVYHWYKFSLGDTFIKNYIPIYFFGLILLSLPLLFNLII